MGNTLSLQNAFIHAQNWYWGIRPFTEPCVVCLEQKWVFKKMHRTQGTERPHLICLDCYKGTSVCRGATDLPGVQQYAVLLAVHVSVRGLLGVPAT